MKFLFALFGALISSLSAAIAWMPYIGIYAFFGALGLLLCLISLPIKATDSQNRKLSTGMAIYGIILGIAACYGSWIWWDSLSHVNGHFF